MVQNSDNQTDINTEHEDDELLTIMEFQHLLCEKLKIGKKSYYEYYRPLVKFKSYGEKVNEFGQLQKSVKRMPKSVAIGLINLLKEQRKPGDPPMEVLKEFLVTKN